MGMKFASLQGLERVHTYPGRGRPDLFRPAPPTGMRRKPSKWRIAIIQSAIREKEAYQARS